MGAVDLDDPASLRKVVGKLTKRCNAFKEELDKCAENQRMLQAAMEERGGIIVQLQHQQEKLLSDNEALSGQLRDAIGERDGALMALAAEKARAEGLLKTAAHESVTELREALNRARFELSLIADRPDMEVLAQYQRDKATFAAEMAKLRAEQAALERRSGELRRAEERVERERVDSEQLLRERRALDARLAEFERERAEFERLRAAVLRERTEVQATKSVLDHERAELDEARLAISRDREARERCAVQQEDLRVLEAGLAKRESALAEQLAAFNAAKASADALLATKEGLEVEARRVRAESRQLLRRSSELAERESRVAAAEGALRDLEAEREAFRAAVSQFDAAKAGLSSELAMSEKIRELEGLAKRLRVALRSVLKRRQPSAPRQSDDCFDKSYVRQVLFRFFCSPSESREALIPVILRVVGATELEVQAAQRQWVSR